MNKYPSTFFWTTRTISSKFITNFNFPAQVRDSFVTKFVYDAESKDCLEDATNPMGGAPLETVPMPFADGIGTSLRFRKKHKTQLLMSPTKKTYNSSSIKKSSVSSIIWSVRRSLRGSQLFNKRGGTYRYPLTIANRGSFDLFR